MYQTQLHANSYFAAHVIAAEERHQADLARVERMRLYREHGNSRDTRGPWGSLRTAVASILIRAGKQLGGAPARTGQVAGSAG